MTQYNRFSFDGRKFPGANALSKYIAEKLGIPKAMPISWQLTAKVFILRKSGEIIFQRSFTSNGVENILREDADA